MGSRTWDDQHPESRDFLRCEVGGGGSGSSLSALGHQPFGLCPAPLGRSLETYREGPPRLPLSLSPRSSCPLPRPWLGLWASRTRDNIKTNRKCPIRDMKCVVSEAAQRQAAVPAWPTWSLALPARPAAAAPSPPRPGPGPEGSLERNGERAEHDREGVKKRFLFFGS